MLKSQITSASTPNPGDIVRVRMRTYLVESVKQDMGYHSIQAVCLDDDAQGQPLEVVWELELDTEVLDEKVWKSIGQRGFDNPKYFSAYIHTLRWNCVTATDPRLFQAPFRAGIRVEPYQLEPLRKALLLPRVNLFIADDVGLGKTIESGLIASELLMRRRVNEIVVSCPPSMIPQWKDELESRFGLTFEVLDRNYIERIRQERGYGVNPWKTYPRFIVSQRLLIDETYAAPLRDWLENFRPGSLLILDEAHHAAPASGAKYAIDSRITRAIRDLAPRFEHRLFLSATPHNGHSNSFSALLEILDPQRFCRGVKVTKQNLDDVMVRRLKEDIRQLVGGFPKRVIKQIDLDNLPDDCPELILSKLLDEYRQIRQRRLEGVSRRKQVEAGLVFCGLQQRLLSSVEAFVRTLKVHRNSMERIWEKSTVESGPTSAEEDKQSDVNQYSLLTDSPGNDDDLSQLNEDELGDIEDAMFKASTESTEGNAQLADVDSEKRLLDQMDAIAEKSRGLPDVRVRYLIDWIKQNMCSGVHTPGQESLIGSSSWNDLRILIFTEYEDTKRYLVSMLQAAITGTDKAESRIEVFHGPTPPDKREMIKRAFNAPPSEHPVRILIATDAGREGLNLQAHCHHLFHFDVPWNPSRLDQRNGRIDRKLQPAPEVYCHYFVYNQRPEDRVLQVLVRKTNTIREELGSLAEVLESRLATTLKQGIHHSQIDQITQELENTNLDLDQRDTTEEELEAVRLRHAQLQEQIKVLERRVDESIKYINLSNESLKDALDCSLGILGVDPLIVQDTPSNEPQRFRFPNLEIREGGDPSWAATLDTLREFPDEPMSTYKWRKEKGIRPVVFQSPQGIDDSVVQLHLHHRVTQRLLGRFLAQGFVHLDLSRACLAQSQDNLLRIILLGRLSIYGTGATRLHEEIIPVTARWTDPSSRKQGLTPYSRDTEAKTLELLETAITSIEHQNPPDNIRRQLLESMAEDIEQLLPHLKQRGESIKTDAEKTLSERGIVESNAMRKILEDQRERVAAELRKPLQLQLDSLKAEEEKRQYQSNRRYWEKRISKFEEDLENEPKRILDFYKVNSYRIEPVGIVYLYPGKS